MANNTNNTSDSMSYITTTRSINLGLCVVGFLMNVLAIIAMKLAVSETRPKHRFVTFLNFSDMIIALSSAVVDVLILRDIEWCNIAGLLHIMAFIGYAALASSLLCIAFDLYIAICFALRYESIMTTKRVNIALAVLWSWSVLVGLSLVYCRLLNMTRSGKSFCNVAGFLCNVFLALFGTHIGVCTFLIVFFNNRVRCSICHMSKGVQPIKNSSTVSNTQSVKKALGSLTLATYTLALFMLPVYFTLLLTSHDEYSLVIEYLLNWSMLNSIADPLIYSLRMTEIRVGYKKIFQIKS